MPAMLRQLRRGYAAACDSVAAKKSHADKRRIAASGRVLRRQKSVSKASAVAGEAHVDGIGGCRWYSMLQPAQPAAT